MNMDLNEAFSSLAKSLINSVDQEEINEINIEETENQQDTSTINIEVEKVNKRVLDFLCENPSFIKEISSNPIVTQEVLDREQKRGQKDEVLGVVKWIIGSQLIFMGVIILCVVLYTTINTNFFKSTDHASLSIIVDLLKYYVTATLAEVIGMLFFIVKHLFS